LKWLVFPNEENLVEENKFDGLLVSFVGRSFITKTNIIFFILIFNTRL